MGRDEMRAADADRQLVADHLKAALDEGRLDLHEYDERLQHAYAAKTYGELHPLLEDLPVASLAVPVQRPGEAASPPVVNASAAELNRRWVAEVWSGWMSVVGVTSAIWLVSSIAAGDPVYFWPIWVAGPWGVVLIFATIGGLAGGEPRKNAEKKARKDRAKRLERERKALAGEPEDEKPA